MLEPGDLLVGLEFASLLDPELGLSVSVGGCGAANVVALRRLNLGAREAESYRLLALAGVASLGSLHF